MSEPEETFRTRCGEICFTVLNPSPGRSSVFSEENGEERSHPQREVPVLGVGSSVGGKFVQTRLGAAEEPGASVRLEGTSCQR